MIGLIWAEAHGRVIGRGGTMPWHFPEDLAHFKRVTAGHPVLMGRRTWQSLPPRYRPLPGRRNIVLTRNRQWQAEGAETARSLDEALVACSDASEIWIIGGSELLARALPIAHRIMLTRIDADIPGDTFAPEIGAQWQQQAREDIVSASGIALSFIRLERGPDSQ